LLKFFSFFLLLSSAGKAPASQDIFLSVTSYSVANFNRKLHLTVHFYELKVLNHRKNRAALPISNSLIISYKGEKRGILVLGFLLEFFTVCGLRVRIYYSLFGFCIREFSIFDIV